MKKIVFCLAISLATTSVFSQTIDRFYIKGGASAMEEFKKAIYFYPDFVSGIVQMKNGQKYMRPLNYNRVVATIEFISEKNDTLAIADEAGVNNVLIGDDVYIFTPACLRTISKGKMKLYSYEKIKIGDVQKVGAFGIPNGSSAIASFNRIDTESKPYNIDVAETIILSKATYLMAETPNHEFIPVNKKTIFKVAPDKEAQIKEYLKTNSVNFNRASEVTGLFNYISGL